MVQAKLQAPVAFFLFSAGTRSASYSAESESPRSSKAKRETSEEPVGKPDHGP